MNCVKKAWMLALLGLVVTTAEGSAAPLPREILGGELIVKDALDKLEAPEGRIRYLPDADLALAFPDHLFYVVLYAPSAVADLPKPLKAATVAAVDPDGRVLFLANPDAILELFKNGFYPRKKGERCKLAVRAALLLVRAEHPGYKLDVPEDRIEITADPQGVKQGVGKLVLAEGGPGDITVTLTLNACCDPTRMVSVVNLKAAKVVTPNATAATIQTATKLVKAKVVEAGLPATEVKDIDDPDLRRLAPGYVFFVVPEAVVTREERKPTKHFTVMVVDPDGVVLTLFGPGGRFGRWINATLGPARDDAAIKSHINILRRLAAAIHPQFRFAAPEAPVIQNEEDGVKRVFLRTPATGPNGAPRVFEVSFTIGKRGKVVAWGIWFRAPESESPGKTG